VNGEDTTYGNVEFESPPLKASVQSKIATSENLGLAENALGHPVFEQALNTVDALLAEITAVIGICDSGIR
jgi:hypothetical protein